jgi:chemotaxis protein histidine kinase CheA
MRNEASPRFASDMPDRLERLRDGLEGGADGVSLQAARDEVEQLQAEAASVDASLTEALQRLALMFEVWECTAAADPRAVVEIRAFVVAALARLADDLRMGTGAAAPAVLTESESHWGEYLRLLDPSCDPTTASMPEEELADARTEDDRPQIAPAELLRRLSGSAPPPQVRASAAPLPASSLAADPSEVRRPSADERGRDDATPARRVPSLDAPSAAPLTVDLETELRDAFVAEASELFERIEAQVLALGDGHDADAIHELGRSFHTLKGAAGSVGLIGLAALIHALEDRLEQAGGVTTDELVRELDEALGRIEKLLADVRGSATGSPPAEGCRGPAAPRSGAGETAGAAPRVEPDAGGPRSDTAGDEADSVIRVSAGRLDELMDLAADLLTRRRFWIEQAAAMERCAARAQTCSQRLRASIERLDDLDPRIAGTGRDVRSSDLVELIRRLSEQAEDLTVLAETARASAAPLTDEAASLSRLSLQLWEVLQDVRIAPVRGLFLRLVRVARDAARIEGRRVEVELIGDDTRLDRSAQDRAFEPLLHAVRNAVGHGIESAEDRARAGKSPAGRVALEAHREGSTVTLTVEDDGRGFDYPAIAAKGRRLGLIAPEETPSNARLDALVFQPGFSTRPQANALAGRGVGMDVVAQEVRQLRGTIELSSWPGAGTRLTIRLPARMSLEQAMVVRVAGRAFALPIDAIEGVQAMEGSDLEGEGACALVSLQGRRIPLVDARAVLGFSGAGCAACPRLLVLRGDCGTAAVLVDAIDGPRELVVRPLGPLLAGHPAILGASLATTGEVVLVLAPSGLIRLARGSGPRAIDRSDCTEEVTRPSALVVGPRGRPSAARR